MPALSRLVLAASLAVSGGGKPKGDQKPAPPARVERPAKEIDIGTIPLTPEAEARLALHDESSTAPGVSEVHRVTKDWDEATGTWASFLNQG